MLSHFSIFVPIDYYKNKTETTKAKNQQNFALHNFIELDLIPEIYPHFAAGILLTTSLKTPS